MTSGVQQVATSLREPKGSRNIWQRSVIHDKIG